MSAHVANILAGLVWYAGTLITSQLVTAKQWFVNLWELDCW